MSLLQFTNKCIASKLTEQIIFVLNKINDENNIISILGIPLNVNAINDAKKMIMNHLDSLD